MTHQIALSGTMFVVVVVAVSMIATFFPKWMVADLALPLASVAAIVQLQDFLRRYFFTCGRGVTAFTNDMMRYLGQLTVLTYLFNFSQDDVDIVTVLWVICGAATLGTVLGIPSLEKLGWSHEALLKTTYRHWNFSKWLLGGALAAWVARNVFFILSGVLLGAAAVGALKAVQSLLGITHIFFQGLQNVVPVRAAWHFQYGGKVTLRKYLHRVALIGGLVTAAIVGIAVVSPEFWLDLVFGDEYRGYGSLLRWFALVYLIMYFSLPLYAGLRAIEHTRSIFYGQLWMALFSLFVAYPMVRFFGLTGAVAGFVASYLILVVSLLLGLRNGLYEATQR